MKSEGKGGEYGVKNEGYRVVKVVYIRFYCLVSKFEGETVLFENAEFEFPVF